MSTADWIALGSAIFSGVSVVVAVIAAVIASRQRRDGQRAAAAAERSAEIAARGERAWVVVQGVQSAPDLRAEHVTLRAVVTLVNNGKTPARDLRTWQKIELRVEPPSEADYPAQLAEGSKGVLGVGEPCQIPAMFQPTRNEFAEIVAQSSALFLYGVAEYRDLIFNKCNRTSWCLRYVPESKEYTYSDRNNWVS